MPTHIAPTKTMPEESNGTDPPKNDEASPSSKKRRICLLLQAVDGVVPYLTPQLLRTCFPVETFGDRLWIGVAVKDTCIVPSFSSVAGDEIEISAAKSAIKAKRKPQPPRGYQFSADTSVDPWMKPYTRVTVPTFDMVADAQGRQHANDAAIIANDQHVMVWTGHGRQSLTPAAYAASAAGLASAYTVPLFDAGAAVSTNDTTIKPKRWEAAQRRTKEWSSDFLKRKQSYNTTLGCGDATQTTASKTIPLYPILVQTPVWQTSLEATLQSLKHESDHHRSGAVLIGWNYLSPDLQRKSLQRATVGIKGAPLGVLATNSLDQILRAVQSGATLIGSNLPQKWAEEKCAFLLDLSSVALAEPMPKRARTNLDDNGCLDLQPPPSKQVADHPWYRDKGPLLPGCMCHACQTHSRAYVYHLVCAKELLAEVLLFIHNLYHLVEVLRVAETNYGTGEGAA